MAMQGLLRSDGINVSKVSSEEPRSNIQVPVQACSFKVWHMATKLIRTDHGTEFALISTVQQCTAHLRSSADHYSVLRSMSRHNHRAERLWPEVNARINHPLKRHLVRMEENQDRHGGQHHKFSVSWVTISTLEVPLRNFVRAWSMQGGRFSKKQ